MNFLSLKCPRCLEGEIFSSKIKIKHNEKCSECDLDFSSLDIGDAPSYCVGFVICFLIPILAIIFDVYFTPNLVTHIFLWIPITIILAYLLLLYVRSYFVYKCYEYPQK
ncbi:MAG: DUF983 domain-containing protein [Rickettsiales bacterium]|nr:DUF983 domain-containing protein [Rickettsiales bacterium]